MDPPQAHVRTLGRFGISNLILAPLSPPSPVYAPPNPAPNVLVLATVGGAVVAAFLGLKARLITVLVQFGILATVLSSLLATFGGYGPCSPFYFFPFSFLYELSIQRLKSHFSNAPHFMPFSMHPRYG